MQIMTKKQKDFLIQLNFNKGIIYGLVIRDGNKLESIDDKTKYINSWTNLIMSQKEESFIHDMGMKEILSFVDHMNNSMFKNEK